jgi:PTH2 family peptidyl-tRNA hydrolase
MTSEMRLYAVVRKDLLPLLGRGKLSGQTGHAFEGALLTAQVECPARATAYLTTAGRAKITLSAKNADTIARIAAACDEIGLPYHLVVDEGRTVFTAPTLTAIGIGPATRDELPKLAQRLQLLD